MSSFSLFLEQDTTGSRTVIWPGNVQWPNGNAPTLSTTPGQVDTFTFACVDGTNWQAWIPALNEI